MFPLTAVTLMISQTGTHGSAEMLILTSKLLFHIKPFSQKRGSNVGGWVSR